VVGVIDLPWLPPVGQVLVSAGLSGEEKRRFSRKATGAIGLWKFTHRLGMPDEMTANFVGASKSRFRR
jgi:hypothetical protein